MSSLAYRPDIDGLRSFAVLSVFAFHLNEHYLPGGFVGVDVFFVISGFLITKILVKDNQADRFSLFGFYDRRFRRILPALVFTLLATLAAGYVIYTQIDFSRLAEQSIYAALGVSNFHFLFTADYFAAAAHTQPLLHTWSLAVEEQFYLFWPLIVLALFKLGRGHAVRMIIGFLLLAIAVSYGLSVWTSPTHPGFAFYMLPTRIWELALGALIVFAPTVSGVRAQAMDMVGLILVIASFILINTGFAFPGWIAIAPCLGAALVLWGKEGRTLGGSFLSLPPLVWIGKVSYSLYLIHWPAIVLFRSWNNGAPPDALEGGLIFLFALALAFFSYFVVEQPFRSRRIANWTATTQKGAPFVVGSSLIAMGACAGLGYQLSRAELLVKPTPERVAHYLTFASDASLRGTSRKCFLDSKKKVEDFDFDACFPEPDGRPRVMLMGESFAGHYEKALEQVFPDVQFSYAIATGCFPLIPFRGRQNCMDFQNKVITEILPNGAFDAVLISGKWDSGHRTHEKIGPTVEAFDGLVDDVVVLGRPPIYQDKLPILLAKSVEAGGDESIIITQEDIAATAELDANMRKGAEEGGATYYSVFDLQCPKSRCTFLTPDDDPMQHDYGHFTEVGAIYMLSRMREEGMFADLLRSK